MPCYEVRTYSIQFRVENTNLLKKTLMALEIRIPQEDKYGMVIQKGYTSARIDLTRGEVSSAINKEALALFTNQIKRAYSATVLDEVARKKKWIIKKTDQNKGQLVRY